jgi:hypothetical protein
MEEWKEWNYEREMRMWAVERKRVLRSIFDPAQYSFVK